jgi:outer membrane protein assembly factor BamA
VHRVSRFSFSLLVFGVLAYGAASWGADPSKPLASKWEFPPVLTLALNENKDAPVGEKANGEVGKEFKSFSEQVAQRIDRIVKKKAFDLWGDPWTVQGIPLIFPSSTDGFNLGVRFALQNIRRQDPHQFELEAQILSSDQGRYKHFIRLDYPHAFDGKFRITTRLSYDRDISLRYYGLGNDTTVIQRRVSGGDPLYNNVRAGPGFNLQILRYIGAHVRLGPTIGLKWTDVMAPAGSLLASQRPRGINGGRTHFIGAAIVNDTTDFEPYPSRGSVHELFANWYAPWLGSDYDFQRYTYTYRQYYPLHRKLILAHRFLFEVLSGDIPFYELGAVGGVNPTLALGGSRFMRGYDGNRFIDRIRMVFGIEARWDPFELHYAKQDFYLGFVPFFDVGRVWPTVLPVKLGDWHASAGWGARILWNSRFVLRADAALTPEGPSFYVDLGNSF